MSTSCSLVGNWPALGLMRGSLFSVGKACFRFLRCADLRQSARERFGEAKPLAANNQGRTIIPTWHPNLEIVDRDRLERQPRARVSQGR